MRFKDQESEGQMQKHVLLLALSHGWAAAREPAGSRPPPVPVQGSSRGSGCPGPSGGIFLLRSALPALFPDLLSPSSHSPLHTSSVSCCVSPNWLSQHGIYRGHRDMVLRVPTSKGCCPQREDWLRGLAWWPAAAPQLDFSF